MLYAHRAPCAAKNTYLPQRIFTRPCGGESSKQAINDVNIYALTTARAYNKHELRGRQHFLPAGVASICISLSDVYQHKLSICLSGTLEEHCSAGVLQSALFIYAQRRGGGLVEISQRGSVCRIRLTACGQYRRFQSSYLSRGSRCTRLTEYDGRIQVSRLHVTLW